MKMTLGRYINKRLDGVQGELPQLAHMMKKSFSASNFRTFWFYWNPIYSYILTYYVYKPLKNIMSQGMARSLTFIVNGLFHDLVVSLVIGSVFYGVTLLFSIYMVILSIEEKLNLNISKLWVRVFYNLTLFLVPFFLTMYLIN